MGFGKWLAQFEADDTPIGDIARDVAQDAAFPKAQDSKAILDYLEDRYACSGALTAFKEAWRMYRRARGMSKKWKKSSEDS